MGSIPPDMYERVHEFSLAIVNASMADDQALADSLCEALRAYFDEQASEGTFHPFLTEATADHTSDVAEAARLYQLALDQSSVFPDEPLYTKMILLAEQLIELGRAELAEAYLRDGRIEAVRVGEAFWIEEADRLLLGLAT